MFLPNALRKITQRSFIVTILMSLPEKLFPSFRINVNNNLIQKNRTIRKQRFHSSDSDSLTSSGSESITSSYSTEERYCCKCCMKLGLEGDMSASEDEKEEYTAAIPSPPPLPPANTDETVEEVKGINMFENMSRVKLKPVNLGNRSLTERRSSPNELLHILKKRYSAMHSPSPRKKYSKYHSYDSDEIDEHKGLFV